MEAQSHAPPGSTCLLALRALLPPAAGEAEALRISWASEIPALDPHCFKETADDNTGRHLFGARMLARPGSQTGGMARPLGVPVNSLVNAGQTRIQPCRARRRFSGQQFRPSPGCRDSRSRRRIRCIELESSQESHSGGLVVQAPPNLPCVSIAANHPFGPLSATLAPQQPLVSTPGISSRIMKIWVLICCFVSQIPMATSKQEIVQLHNHCHTFRAISGTAAALTGASATTRSRPYRACAPVGSPESDLWRHVRCASRRPGRRRGHIGGMCVRNGPPARGRQ